MLQISLVVSLCDASVPDPVSEPAIRALVSLTYPDRLAIPLVVNQEDFIPMLVKQVNSTSVEVRRHAGRLPTQSRLHIRTDREGGYITCNQVQRQAIKCLTNLAVHDANKPRLVEASGTKVQIPLKV